MVKMGCLMRRLKNLIERFIYIINKNCIMCKHFVYFGRNCGMCNVVDNRLGYNITHCMSKCACGNFKKRKIIKGDLNGRF